MNFVVGDSQLGATAVHAHQSLQVWCYDWQFQLPWLFQYTATCVDIVAISVSLYSGMDCTVYATRTAEYRKKFQYANLSHYYRLNVSFAVKNVVTYLKATGENLANELSFASLNPVTHKTGSYFRQRIRLAIKDTLPASWT